jgi:hypothetical protein
MLKNPVSSIAHLLTSLIRLRFLFFSKLATGVGARNGEAKLFLSFAGGRTIVSEELEGHEGGGGGGG